MRLPAISHPSPRVWTVVRRPPDLAEVFARYGEPVYRFLYSRLGNREDAEDLTVEVFLKASRGLDIERPEASIAGWLFAVARTVLADHWRRYYRAGACLPLDDARAAALPDPLADSKCSEQSTRYVAALLDGLPEHYRRVLELRFLDGYSIRETARAMGLTEGNVKVLQHRALARAAQVAVESP